jgi:CRISPR system Cascade subunit CasE
MYLSKLTLNEREKAVYRDLGNSHKLHQRIMQGFPDETSETPRQDWHILYRQEPDSLIILVQSAIEPDWQRLPQNYLQSFDVKPLNWEEKLLTDGNLYQFRLKANPSKRDNKTKKTRGIYHNSEQIAWLERKGEQHGFKVTGIDVIPTPKTYGKKSQEMPPISIYSVLFQGMLQVTDSDSFTRCLREGIGRGRSYGCGLLSIAKLNPISRP